MIYITLFLVFLKIGLFAFGGAYGAIPLIRENVLAHGWMDEAMFSNMIAISESTPGPIMVNAATYIGSSQAGISGAAVATLGVVLPSFVIILVVTALFRSCLKNRRVQAVLRGVKPCLMGVIFATGAAMAVKAVFPAGIFAAIFSSGFFSAEAISERAVSACAVSERAISAGAVSVGSISERAISAGMISERGLFDPVAAVILGILVIAAVLGKRVRKKEISPILLIVAAGGLGSLLYGAVL